MAARDRSRTGVISGMLSGFGLFETMRAYRGRIVAVDAHLARLSAAARRCGPALPLTRAAMKQRLMRAVRACVCPDARVRLALFEDNGGSRVVITAEPYSAPPAAQYRRGYTACISALSVDGSSPLAGVKSASRMLYEMAFRQAAARGFDEAILTDRRGCLSEGSRSNLFFVRGRRVLTPSLGCGCLPGITRALVIDRCRREKISVREGAFLPSGLLDAGEAFLTNSLMGIMPLTVINGRRIGRGLPGPVTVSMMRFYKELVRSACSHDRLAV